jgi:hypothetical protein
MQRAVRAFAPERFALSIRPAKSNALSPQFTEAAFAVRAGHRTAHQPLDGYAGRETAAPDRVRLGANEIAMEVSNRRKFLRFPNYEL